MAGDLPSAQAVRRGNGGGGALCAVVLSYDERLLRRRRLVTADGCGFMVDLPETVGVDAGDCFVLTDGRLIEVVAAEEHLMEVQGDLPRLAWHIGNRHAPCQIDGDRLLIRRDHVLRRMLEGLGAVVGDVTGAFRPEGGAYGYGRTMGHSHGGHDHGEGVDLTLLAGLGRDAG